MNTAITSLIVLACLFAAVFLGKAVRRFLPEDHLTALALRGSKRWSELSPSAIERGFISIVKRAGRVFPAWSATSPSAILADGIALKSYSQALAGLIQFVNQY